MNEPVVTPEPPSEKTPARGLFARLGWLSWSSLLFAFVQSVCTAFVALSGVRLFVGAVAFAGAVGVLEFADKLHVDPIRIPMIVLALVGAVVNLLAVWQARRLRKRGASAWRQRPLSTGKQASERTQLVLAVLTIFLLIAEELAHWKHSGHG
jgi:hypothetical protein